MENENEGKVFIPMTFPFTKKEEVLRCIRYASKGLAQPIEIHYKKGVTLVGLKEESLNRAIKDIKEALKKAIPRINFDLE